MLNELKIDRKNFGEYIHVIPFEKDMYIFRPRPILSMIIEDEGLSNYDIIAPLVIEILKPKSISNPLLSGDIVAEVPKLAQILKWGCESWDEYVNTQIN